MLLTIHQPYHPPFVCLYYRSKKDVALSCAHKSNFCYHVISLIIHYLLSFMTIGCPLCTQIYGRLIVICTKEAEDKKSLLTATEVKISLQLSSRSQIYKYGWLEIVMLYQYNSKVSVYRHVMQVLPPAICTWARQVTEKLKVIQN